MNPVEKNAAPPSHDAVDTAVQRAETGYGPYPTPDAGQVNRVGGEEPNFHLIGLSEPPSLGFCVGTAARCTQLTGAVGMAYAVLNSWTAMAASLSVALPSGGPTAVIWGIVPSFIGNMAMAASMAEMWACLGSYRLNYR